MSLARRRGLMGRNMSELSLRRPSCFWYLLRVFLPYGVLADIKHLYFHAQAVPNVPGSLFHSLQPGALEERNAYTCGSTLLRNYWKSIYVQTDNLNGERMKPNVFRRCCRTGDSSHVGKLQSKYSPNVLDYGLRSLGMKFPSECVLQGSAWFVEK